MNPSAGFPSSAIFSVAASFAITSWAMYEIGPVQTRQIDWLIAARPAFSEPTIVAGDFNMTPWSYRLQRLLASAGLRRHATFLRSWPTDRYPQFRLPAPAFLIDHVLSTPDIKSVSIRMGPNLGSDHLPVIARVRLP